MFDPLDAAPTATTPPGLGDLIASLGEAVETGRLSMGDAVARLRAADPTLHDVGAAGQLRAWRTAIARYAALTQPRSGGAPPVDAREFRARPPIVFRFAR